MELAPTEQRLSMQHGCKGALVHHSTSMLWAAYIAWIHLFQPKDNPFCVLSAGVQGVHGLVVLQRDIVQVYLQDRQCQVLLASQSAYCVNAHPLRDTSIQFQQRMISETANKAPVEVYT